MLLDTIKLPKCVKWRSKSPASLVCHCTKCDWKEWSTSGGYLQLWWDRLCNGSHILTESSITSRILRPELFSTARKLQVGYYYRSNLCRWLFSTAIFKISSSIWSGREQDFLFPSWSKINKIHICRLLQWQLLPCSNKIFWKDFKNCRMGSDISFAMLALVTRQSLSIEYWDQDIKYKLW